MKSPALTTSIALLSVAFVPFQAARADAELGAFDPSAILRPPAAQTSDLFAFDMNRVVTTQMRFIRYEASAYQRKVAEARARAYVAAHRKSVAKAQTTAKTKPAPEPKKTAKPKQPSEPSKPEPKVAAKTKETKVAAEPKPLPRYIAVDTVKDKRASPKAKKVVMIWDTHAETLVGNNIYDVENPPTVGANTRFETYSTQYIGAGL